MTRNTIFVIFAGLILIVSISTNGSVYASPNNSNQVTRQCENLYVKYLDLGEQKFAKEYWYLNNLDSCMKLYKDPNWTFNGKEKLDKQYSKLNQVSKSNKIISNPRSISILYKIKSGNAFNIGFNVCAGPQTLQSTTIFVKSDTEQFILTSKKPILHDTCKFIETSIISKYANNITVDWATDAIMSQPRIQVKTI